MQRFKGGRGLTGLEDCVQAETHNHEKILNEVSHIRTIENNIYGKTKEETHKEHQEKYKGKPHHGQFRKATEEVRIKRSWD